MTQQPETVVRQRNPNALGRQPFWRAECNDVYGYGRTPLDAIVDLLNAERDAEQLAADVCRTAGI